MATKTTDARLKASTGTRKPSNSETPSLFDIEWDRDSLSVAGEAPPNERSIDRLAQRVKARDANRSPQVASPVKGRSPKGRYIPQTLHSRFTERVTYEDSSLFGVLNDEEDLTPPASFDDVPMAESIPWDDDSAYRRVTPPSLAEAGGLDDVGTEGASSAKDPRGFYKKMRRASRSQASFRKSGVQRVEPLADPYASPPLRIRDDVDLLPEASEDRKVLSSFDPDEPDRPRRKKRGDGHRQARENPPEAPEKEGPSLLAQALAFLSRREYSRRELGKKLALKASGEVDKAMIDSVLDELEKLNYLSDERYALTRAKAKSRQLGDRRVRYELRQSGVSAETVSQAMEAVQESEPIRCLRVWSRRFQERPTDRKERDRQVRYLAYRGFSMESIFKVLRGEVELPEEDGIGGSLWD